MTDRTAEILGTLGVNIPETLSRMLDNEEFYFSVLKSFPEDGTFNSLKSAMEEERYEDAFKAAHTLKGLCANLGLGGIGDFATDLTEVLRNPPYDAGRAKELFELVSDFYSVTVKGINEIE